MSINLNLLRLLQLHIRTLAMKLFFFFFVFFLFEGCTPNTIYLQKSEDDCTKTHLCYMGKFLPNRNCPPNQAYDKSIKKCSTEAYKQCIASTLTVKAFRFFSISVFFYFPLTCKHTNARKHVSSYTHATHACTRTHMHVHTHNRV